MSKTKTIGAYPECVDVCLFVCVCVHAHMHATVSVIVSMCAVLPSLGSGTVTALQGLGVKPCSLPPGHPHCLRGPSNSFLCPVQFGPDEKVWNMGFKEGQGGVRGLSIKNLFLFSLAERGGEGRERAIL